jgi:hypothetical protein
MLQARPLRWLASSVLALCVSGCAPDDERSRITTQLPPEGYALFRVSPGNAKRVAILVEMRDVKDASFVLLYTPKEPKSSGWFELDATDYTPCRHYGAESIDDVELGCVLPNGHGALVDVVDAKPWPSTVLLRHQLGDGLEDLSCKCTKPAPGGWYAVMRIAKTGPAIPIAVEVVSMDETDGYEEPSVEHIR